MEVAWVEACEGGLEVGGGEERVALVLGLVRGKVVATPAAATAATKEELGGGGCWCRSNTWGWYFSECSQVHWGGLGGRGA